MQREFMYQALVFLLNFVASHTFAFCSLMILSLKYITAPSYGVQVCDATGDGTSVVAGLKKIFLEKKIGGNTICK
jgi:hypothetical protein